MILLAAGTGVLARLMRLDARGPDTAWLLAGPTELAVEPAEDPEAAADPLPLAAE